LIMAADPMLVRIELTFRTTSDQDVDQVAERIKESVRMIVGRETLDEFRVRTLPLGERRGPRTVD
jgi:hypothetical protein